MAHKTRTFRPDCERAHSFTAHLCADEGCGLHLIAMRKGDEPICEMVVGREQLLSLLTYIHDHGLDLP